MGLKIWRNVNRTFLNLVLKGKLRKAVQLVCEIEKGGVLKPDELADDLKCTIKETVTSVLEGKYHRKTIPSCATLETYEVTPIFIPLDITDKSVELVAQKNVGEFLPRRHIL